MVQALGLGDRGRERHVTGGPHIGPSKHHEQVDRRRPAADAGDGLERPLYLGVIEAREGSEIQRAVDEGARQRAAVPRLLAAEADREELGIGEPEETIRGQRIGGGLEAPERGQRRGERHLLLEHDVDQGAEAWRAVPERRRTEPRGDPGKVRIRGSELGDGPLERCLVERRDQATVPRVPNPAAGSGSNGRPSAPRSHALAFSPSEGRW